MRTARVKMLVLDEADKLLQGAFVAQVADIQRAMPERIQALAFSATYTQPQRAALARWMREPSVIAVDQQPDGAPVKVLRVAAPGCGHVRGHARADFA